MSEENKKVHKIKDTVYRCYVCKRELSIDEICSVDQFGHKYCSDKCAIEACGEEING